MCNEDLWALLWYKSALFLFLPSFFVVASTGIPVGCQYVTDQTGRLIAGSSGGGNGGDAADEPLILDRLEGYEDIMSGPLDRGPYFDVSASKNVTALVGTTAYLNCRVKNLQNRTVSTYVLICFSLSFMYVCAFHHLLWLVCWENGL